MPVSRTLLNLASQAPMRTCPLAEAAQANMASPSPQLPLTSWRNHWHSSWPGAISPGGLQHVAAVSRMREHFATGWRLRGPFLRWTRSNATCSQKCKREVAGLAGSQPNSMHLPSFRDFRQFVSIDTLNCISHMALALYIVSSVHARAHRAAIGAHAEKKWLAMGRMRMPLEPMIAA